LWIIIAASIGYYLGQKTTEIPIYEQKIKELEDRHEKMKQDIYKIIEVPIKPSTIHP